MRLLTVGLNIFKTSAYDFFIINSNLYYARAYSTNIFEGVSFQSSRTLSIRNFVLKIFCFEKDLSQVQLVRYLPVNCTVYCV